MRSIWKLLPIAAVLAVGIALASWSKPASADVASVTPSLTAPAIGTPVTISATATNATLSQAITVLATGAGAGTFAAGATLAPDGTPFIGGGSNFLSVNAASPGNKTLTGVTFTCTSAGAISIIVSQQGAIGASTNITCGGTGGTGNIVVTPASVAIGQSATLSGSCTAGQTITANSGGIFTYASPPSTVSGVNFFCGATGAYSATFVCQITGTVTFSGTVGSATLSCGTTGTGTIVVTPSTASYGQPVTVTGNCTTTGEQITATPAAFTLAITNVTVNSQSAASCLAPGAYSIQATCQTTASVTFTQGAQYGYLNCGSGTGYGGLSVNPPSGNTATVTGTCTTVGQALTVTGPGAFTYATINSTPVVTAQGQSSIICSTTGTITATYVCNGTGTALFALGGLSGQLACGGVGTNTGCYGQPAYNPLYPYQNQYPQYCATPVVAASGAPASVTVTSSPTSLSCTGSNSVSFVTVAVKDANGNKVAQGTAVTIAVDAGTISPATQTTDASGSVNAIYSAPSTATASSIAIKATAGTITGQTNVSLSCAATAPSASTGGTAPPPPPPPSSVPVIAPPNTGDAGLAAGSTSRNWGTYAGFVAVAGALIGSITLVAKVRA